MTTTFIIVPGYTNSGSQHWQSYIERKYHNVVRVIQDDWNAPNHKWIERLNDMVQNTEGELVLIGHSCGAVCVAQWASQFPNNRVKAMILATPADVDSPSALLDIQQQRPLPNKKLPSPSLLIYTDNDPHLGTEKAHQLAETWGSQLMLVKGGEHLNTDAGYGEWHEGERLIEEFTGRGFVRR
ncbi:RBBP9/YdeN family alpha/beta hydrolase [Providencia alcalifaciens]|jgi:predicted alpha/beta hydrolase family esterase|uniref:RBBP9/YdeN family alpha/beta hydrolase n=1 Tax=Providencia alcalifaciens TaxID=126385 RepID=UPI002836E48D|nr:alpha/beta hydrolase [Providencia alcalifaciens]